MKSIERKNRKGFSLFITVLLLIGLLPMGIWAEGGLTLSQTGQKVYYAGTSSQFDVQISVRNDSSQTITGITGTIDKNVFPESPFNDKASINSLKAGETGTMVFSVNTTSLVPGRSYSIPVQVTGSAGSTSMKAVIEVANLTGDSAFQKQIQEKYQAIADASIQLEAEDISFDQKKALTDQIAQLRKEIENLQNNKIPASVNAPRITISPNFSPILPGQVNMLAVTVANTGNTPFNSVNFTIGALPEGMTLKNTSTLQQVGSIAVGDKKTVVFPVDVKKDAKGGNYPLGFSAAGTYTATDKEGATSLQNYTMEQTFYITVNSGGASSTNRSGLAIENIQAPASALPGKEFAVSFTVVNRGVAEAKDFKVTVEGAETVVNKSKNIFVENSLGAGQSKNYSITFFALTSTGAKYYPIKISIDPLAVPKEGEEAPIPVIQYTGIFIDGKDGEKDPNASDGVKSPQIMVTKYTYGGKYVEAGKTFDLHFTLKNTSEKALRNIKVSLTADEGTFVPYNTSNAVFVSRMNPGATSEQVITFATKPDAPQKTVGISVDSAYEDMKGNAVTAKDIISIPVMQKTVLSVDDIMSNPGAMVGMPASVNVQFYNLGKTTLSNMKVTGSGNFEAQGSPSYFAGNLEPGKSDSFEYSFIPKEAGEQEGKITFIYEDAAGDEKTLEKSFSIEVMEAMPTPSQNPEDMQPMPEQGGFNKMLLIPIIGLPALALTIFLIRRKKKKKEQELEIDED